MSRTLHIIRRDPIDATPRLADAFQNRVQLHLDLSQLRLLALINLAVGDRLGNLVGQLSEIVVDVGLGGANSRLLKKEPISM